MANAADKTAVVTENLRDIPFDKLEAFYNEYLK